MNDNMTPVTIKAFGFAVVAVAILLVTIWLIFVPGKDHKTKRPRTRWTYFAVGVFLSALTLNLGLLLVDDEQPLLDTLLKAIFNSIQMIDAGRDLTNLKPANVGVEQLAFVRFVEELLYICSPVAFLGAVASYLSRFLARPRARLRCRIHANTYVFSELNEASLVIAQNVHDRIRGRHKLFPHPFTRGANLLFCSVNRDSDDDLQIRAARLGALCLEDSIEGLRRDLFGHHTLRLVLLSKDEVANITRAAALRRACKRTARKHRLQVLSLLYGFMESDRMSKTTVTLSDRQNVERQDRRGTVLKQRTISKIAGLLIAVLEYQVIIYSVTSLYGAESMLVVAEQDNERDHRLAVHTNAAVKHVPGITGFKRVRTKRVDWTRNLVESALLIHPLFLLGKQPDMPAKDDESAIDSYISWQSAMYERKTRHIVIVGGGHVGMEFLKLSLSTSRFKAPDGEDPLCFRFDVFDSKEDALAPGECLAKRRLEADAPGYAGGRLSKEFNVHFHLVEVLGPDFEDKLRAADKTNGGITYVFVSLGDDLKTAQAALRIRESLERIRIRRHTENWDTQPERQRSYVGDCKPVVLAVVDDSELSESLGVAEDDGFDYEIDTIGSDEQMYTLDLVFGSDARVNEAEKTEYKRRSIRASDLHKKYKLYAFMSSQDGQAFIVSSAHASGVDDDCSLTTTDLVVDWSADLVALADDASVNEDDDASKKAISLFNDYARPKE